MSIQKCLLDNSSRMIKAMSTAKSNSNEVKTVSEVYKHCLYRLVCWRMIPTLLGFQHNFVGYVLETKIEISYILAYVL